MVPAPACARRRPLTVEIQLLLIVGIPATFTVAAGPGEEQLFSEPCCSALPLSPAPKAPPANFLEKAVVCAPRQGPSSPAELKALPWNTISTR